MFCRNHVISNTIRKFWSVNKVDFGKYNIVTPGTVSSPSFVPDKIIKPVYHATGEPGQASEEIDLKNAHNLNKMRESCKLASNILKYVGETLRIGQTTDDIDKLVHRLAIENNAYPSPLNYRNFPKSVCTSVNNVACHGIPDDRAIENGDIINVDITLFHNGYHGDCSKTFLIGDVDSMGRDLVKATEICLENAISICKPQVHFRSIGHVIEETARKLGFKVVPCFIGHGIGTYFHGPPDIYHFTNFFPGVMTAGMTFTIEPVLSQGGSEIEILEDGWTAITVDGSRTAQFEHTILITDDGFEILTLPSQS